MRKNKLYCCRVCGMFYESPPWGLDNKIPSFNICYCCGVEFGYEDATKLGIEGYRREWIDSGAKWFNKKLQPKDWNLYEQLKNLDLE